MGEWRPPAQLPSSGGSFGGGRHDPHHDPVRAGVRALVHVGDCRWGGDLAFLDAEFDRLGVPFPLTLKMGVCTMTWPLTF
jgi:hypothetical protein